MRNLFGGISLMVLVLGFSAYAAYPQLTLKLADIHSPAFHAKNIKLQIVGQLTSRLVINIEEIGIQENIWRNLNLSCDQFEVDENDIQCVRGQLKVSESVSFPLTFFCSIVATKRSTLSPVICPCWSLNCLKWSMSNTSSVRGVDSNLLDEIAFSSAILKALRFLTRVSASVLAC